MIINLDFDYDPSIIDAFIAQSFTKPDTRRDYRREILLFMQFAGKSFLDVEREDCLAYVESLMERTALPKYDPKRLSVATVEKKYSYLMKFFNYLAATLGTVNHFHTIEKPVATREIAPEKVLPKEVIQQLIDYLRDGPLRVYVVLMLAFTSGLWTKEICSLTWARLIEDADGNHGFVFPGPGQTQRFVKIDPVVYELMMDYWEECERPPKHFHIFLSDAGKPLSERGLRYLMEQAVTQAGLEKKYTLRDLRHTGSILQMKNGASAEEMMQHFGWQRKNYATRLLNRVKELERSPVDFLGMDLAKKVPHE